MRARRSGHIVNLSSIVGLVPQPGTGLYSASKFAIEGLSQSLALELAPLGIGVTIVEPGSFRTDFLSSASLQKAANRIEDYSQSAHPVVERLSGFSGRQPGNPVRAAQAIVDAVCSPNPPQQLLLGSDAYQRMQTRQQQVVESMERWREVTLGTDFTPGS
jgi:NAD(P)-dependent dehydrogenase (short-subunit alcohol dehydrogenase family)